jgi:hypothetical protein
MTLAEFVEKFALLFSPIDADDDLERWILQLQKRGYRHIAISSRPLVAGGAARNYDRYGPCGPRRWPAALPGLQDGAGVRHEKPSKRGEP